MCRPYECDKEGEAPGEYANQDTYLMIFFFTNSHFIFYKINQLSQLQDQQIKVY